MNIIASLMSDKIQVETSTPCARKLNDKLAKKQKDIGHASQTQDIFSE